MVIFYLQYMIQSGMPLVIFSALYLNGKNLSTVFQNKIQLSKLFIVIIKPTPCP